MSMKGKTAFILSLLGGATYIGLSANNFAQCAKSNAEANAVSANQTFCNPNITTT